LTAKATTASYYRWVVRISLNQTVTHDVPQTIRDVFLDGMEFNIWRFKCFPWFTPWFTPDPREHYVRREMRIASLNFLPTT